MPEQARDFARKVVAAGQVEKDPPADIEIDENGKVTTPLPPITAANAGERGIAAAADWVGDKVGRTTPEQAAQNELNIMRLRNAVDQKAIPALYNLERNHPAWMAMEKVRRASEGLINRSR